MGIATVAVYSEADADALHVRDGRRGGAHRPGAVGARAISSSTGSSRPAKQTGAEAVHPGYGFLSENAAFAAALEEAGIVFIGPTPRAIAAMGDKIAVEEARAAGRRHHRARPSRRRSPTPSRRSQIAQRDRLSGDDQGVGRRRRQGHAHRPQRRRGCARASRSAAARRKSSFGDDRVFIEKFIEEPRHIEIQVLGDAHGNVVYLGERECSIQRRHQKVIEEAPSPFLDDATREAMGEQAVALAKAVGLPLGRHGRVHRRQATATSTSSR